MAFSKMTTAMCILRLMKATLFPPLLSASLENAFSSPCSSLQTRSDELNRHCLTKCQRRNKSASRHHQRRKVTGKAKNEDHQAVITVLLASSLPINFLIPILFPTSYQTHSSFDIVISSSSIPSWICGSEPLPYVSLLSMPTFL